jgi:thiamine-monophosphate kinase
MGDTVPFGPGREFELIRAFIDRWGSRAAGIGDDAAVLSPPLGTQLVVSTDASVENVHFRRDWLSAREIGYRAAASALSDLAAMAAEPLGLLAALSCPREWLGDLDEVMDGIGEAAERSGAPIVGGDLTAARELALTITVLGAAAEPVSRRGAQVGDGVYVTGILGGPLAATTALQGGREPAAAARERFARPTPRIREARWLANHGARAMIDISDGLVGDVAHIAAASGVHIVLELGPLPTVDDVTPAQAARSGEEYELVAVAPTALDVTAFTREFGVPLTHVGRVEAGVPGVDTCVDGVRVASAPGFSHFS